MTSPSSGILDLLGQRARRHAGRTAVTERARSVSYAELAEMVGSRADQLGALPEHAVLLFQPRRDIDSIVTVLAGIAARPLLLVADPAWGRDELDGVVTRCAVTHRVGVGAALRPVEAGTRSGPPPRDALADAAFGRFTSGSTGGSRCLAFSEATALAAAGAWAEGSGIADDDRIVCCAAFHNGLAFNTSLLAVLGAGAELLLPGEGLLPNAVARLVEERGATRLVGFPFFLDLVVRQGLQGRFERLRQIVSSADKLAARTAQALREVCTVCDYYGLAEVGPCTFDDGTRLGSVGTPLPGVSVRVMLRPDGAGPGRVAVRTGWMADGYLDGTAGEWAGRFSDGHYLTSDIGRIEQGSLFLEGRVGPVLNVAGRKIDPSEVEAALCGIEGVQQAHVLQVHVHDRPALAAFIESASLTRRDVVQSLSGRLADYKIPSAIRVMERLPRGEAGKVSRERLLAQFEEGLAAS